MLFGPTGGPFAQDQENKAFSRTGAAGLGGFTPNMGYLRDVLLRLSAGETDLEPLLPDRWEASHPEHVLQHRLDESRRKAARQKEARQARRAGARPKG